MKTLDKINDKIDQLEGGLLQGQTPLANLELGILYQTIKDYDKAEAAFKKAIAILPQNVYPRFLLLRLYETKGEWSMVNRLARELMQSNNPRMSIGLKLEVHKILFWNAETEKTKFTKKSTKKQGLKKTVKLPVTRPFNYSAV